MAPATHRKLTRYAQLTNQTLSEALNEIVDDWMETIGAARIEAITETAHSDVFAPKKCVVVDISHQLD